MTAAELAERNAAAGVSGDSVFSGGPTPTPTPEEKR